MDSLPDIIAAIRRVDIMAKGDAEPTRITNTTEFQRIRNFSLGAGFDEGLDFRWCDLCGEYHDSSSISDTEAYISTGPSRPQGNTYRLRASRSTLPPPSAADRQPAPRPAY